MHKMISSQDACPCGRAQTYAECCQPLHHGTAAQSAERLMRSRYSAYTLGLIDYLVATTLPAQQGLLEVEQMRLWSAQSQWQGLSVEQVADGPGSDRAQVAFVARWADPDGSQQSHRECSDFKRLGERWYFIDPNHVIKAGRNEPCPCGSGRKFKQCCAL
ncbi:SEC-C motif-containing protein [Halopseudomonas sabulinigri]|uniref:SEC-C motif-containing protein n=1 Tax=Halopseudomonas sabulinigri TaxID=472181 RepID=A0A1H1X9Z0_9GAMM|nr:YchJ family protein [Halopseudomonas sabulinigri]SDT05479.1 SEC-C motif-containing protein [Halopseudomonas sabulinigri]